MIIIYMKNSSFPSDRLPLFINTSTAQYSFNVNAPVIVKKYKFQA